MTRSRSGDANISSDDGGMSASILPSYSLICSAMTRADASSVRSVTRLAILNALRLVVQLLNATTMASGISSQPSSSPRRLLAIQRPQRVAKAAQRADGHAAALELLAHTVHVDLDRIHGSQVVKAEHGLGQRCLRDHAPRRQDKGLQRRMLALGQGQVLAAQQELPRVGFKLQWSAGNALRLAVQLAAQLGANAGFQLIRIKRLDQIVVRPVVEPGDAARDRV